MNLKERIIFATPSVSQHGKPIKVNESSLTNATKIRESLGV